MCYMKLRNLQILAIYQFIPQKIEQGLTQFLEKQVNNRVKTQDISFAVAGNGKTHMKKVSVSLTITVTRKVTRLCAIAWELSIW